MRIAANEMQRFCDSHWNMPCYGRFRILVSQCISSNAVLVTDVDNGKNVRYIDKIAGRTLLMI